MEKSTAFSLGSELRNMITAHLRDDTTQFMFQLIIMCKITELSTTFNMHSRQKRMKTVLRSDLVINGLRYWTEYIINFNMQGRQKNKFSRMRHGSLNLKTSRWMSWITEQNTLVNAGEAKIKFSRTKLKIRQSRFDLEFRISIFRHFFAILQLICY